jgi:hypothetical protein
MQNIGQLGMLQMPVGLTNSMQNIQSEQYGDNPDTQDLSKHYKSNNSSSLSNKNKKFLI